jgi:hypothetical protein
MRYRRNAALQLLDDSLRVGQALSHVGLVRFENPARQIRIASVKDFFHLATARRARSSRATIAASAS